MLTDQIKTQRWIFVLVFILPMLACTKQGDSAIPAYFPDGIPKSNAPFKSKGFYGGIRWLAGETYAFYDGKTKCPIPGDMELSSFAEAITFDAANHISFSSGCAGTAKSVPPNSLHFFSFDESFVAVDQSPGIFMQQQDIAPAIFPMVWGRTTTSSGENRNVIVDDVDGNSGHYRSATYFDGGVKKHIEKHDYISRVETPSLYIYTSPGGFSLAVAKAPFADDVTTYPCSFSDAELGITETTVMVCLRVSRP